MSSCSEGIELTEDGLARIFLDLERAGAENVNIVTGSHFAPGILAALALARSRGLAIPMVWNCSGYETPETVGLLSDAVSFFLPDLKTLDAGLSREHLHAADYPARAAAALLAMVEAKPLGPDAEAPTQGVIVRHLVLPGRTRETRDVLSWFRTNLAGRALLSLMFQYTPIPGRPLAAPFDRMTSAEEHGQVLAMLEELGIDEGFFQEPVPDDGWLPDFGRPRPFSSELARMVWHYRDGPPR